MAAGRCRRLGYGDRRPFTPLVTVGRRNGCDGAQRPCSILQNRRAVWQGQCDRFLPDVHGQADHFGDLAKAENKRREPPAEFSLNERAPPWRMDCAWLVQEQVPDAEAIVAFRQVGYFRERFDSSLPSLRNAVRSTPHPDSERIIAYLVNGIRDEVLFCGCYIPDALDSEKSFCVAPGPVTDGVWLWPPDLAYYVRNYNVALPDEFIMHMSRNGWSLPALSDAEKRQIDDMLQRCMLGKLSLLP